MTRQRRSHILALALVPAVVFGAVRCADSTATAPSVNARATAPARPELAAKMAKLHEATDWIGQFHNDALAYVYANLRRMPAKGRNRHSICEAARAAYGEFHKARRGTSVPASVDAQLESYCADGDIGGSRATLSGSGQPARAELSSTAQSLMDQVAGAVDASTSYGDLSNQVASIESVAASSLTYDEATAVFTVGSVALSSADYWASNLTSWIPFTNSADYGVLLATRTIPAGSAPAFNNGEVSGGWSAFASSVWNDVKRAAKRAAGGDVRAAAKSVIGSALVEAPFIYELVIGAAAAGSIGAVLQL